MTLRVFLTLLVGTSILFACTYTLAQDNASAGPTAQATETSNAEADIAALIRDLDADRFSKRQDASRKLKGMGLPAIDALTKAALGESREASRRSLEILKGHFASGDIKLKEAATSALKKLTESAKAPIARSAKDVLEPKPVQAPQQMLPFGPNQIQIQFRAGGAQRVQIRNVNGVKDIDVKENGRSIKIQDDPNKGITVEITEKVDGKDVKKKYQAKDAAELKKKHPDAHKVYEKYNQGGGIQIQALQGKLFQIPAMQQAMRGGKRRRLVDAEPIAEQLKKISAQVEEAQKQLEQLKSNPQQTESLEKAIEQLKKAQNALKEARDKTEE